jgi:hypothetical protein
VTSERLRVAESLEAFVGQIRHRNRASVWTNTAGRSSSVSDSNGIGLDHDHRLFQLEPPIDQLEI